MALATWRGGGSNDATDPTQWVGGTVPTSGDDIRMSGGTMNITGDPLGSQTLNIDDNPAGLATRDPIVFNLSGDATLDQNMSLIPVSSGSITFNLDQTTPTTWTGGFGSSFTDVRVVGTGTWINGQSGINGASAVVDPNVIAGAGPNQFFVNAAQRDGPVVDGSLEFKSAVGPGLTVDVEGDAASEAIATLIIDQPTAFKADVTLGFGEIVLRGLGPVDSYASTDTTLSLYSGATLVDTLSLTKGGVLNFGVSIGTAADPTAVVVHGDGPRFGSPAPEAGSSAAAAQADSAPLVNLTSNMSTISADSLNIGQVSPGAFLQGLPEPAADPGALPTADGSTNLMRLVTDNGGMDFAGPAMLPQGANYLPPALMGSASDMRGMCGSDYMCMQTT